MHAEVRRFGLAFAAGLLLLQMVGATIVPAVSFEELADSSDFVVAGRVTRSWAAWDASHKYIWTHYELSVQSAQKGAPGSTVEFAEPGGVLGNVMMTIAGSVSYQAGDNVVVFLSRMPNGFIRTAAWGQGKYTLDANQRLHSAAASLRSLEGLTLGELKVRLDVRSRAVQGSGRIAR